MSPSENRCRYMDIDADVVMDRQMACFSSHEANSLSSIPCLLQLSSPLSSTDSWFIATKNFMLCYWLGE